jgi:hypothetical protein
MLLDVQPLKKIHFLIRINKILLQNLNNIFSLKGENKSFIDGTLLYSDLNKNNERMILKINLFFLTLLICMSEIEVRSS